MERTAGLMPCRPGQAGGRMPLVGPLGLALLPLGLRSHAPPQGGALLTALQDEAGPGPVAHAPSPCGSVGAFGGTRVAANWARAARSSPPRGDVSMASIGAFTDRLPASSRASGVGIVLGSGTAELVLGRHRLASDPPSLRCDRQLPAAGLPEEQRRPAHGRQPPVIARHPQLLRLHPLGSASRPAEHNRHPSGRA